MWDKRVRGIQLAASPEVKAQATACPVTPSRICGTVGVVVVVKIDERKCARTPEYRAKVTNTRTAQIHQSRGPTSLTHRPRAFELIEELLQLW